MKWSVVVPLIGGLPLGVEKAFHSQPEYVLSYSCFQNNDKHYINYLREHSWNGKYIVLDELKEYIVPNVTTEYIDDELPVDIVCALPVCGGLSTLSKKASADNPANDWMYNISNFVLKHIKPRIYFGENAVFLALNRGRKVADNLYDIAKKNGYSFMIFHTENRFLGNPQKRPRSFFFFFKKSEFPSIPLITLDKQFVRYIDFMKDAGTNNTQDLMNVYLNNDKVSDGVWYKVINDIIKSESYTDFLNKLFIKSDEKDVNLYAKSLSLYENHLDDLAEWLKNHGYQSESDKVLKVKRSFESGHDIWLYNVIVGRNQIPAFVAASGSAYHMAHPFEDRFLTVREMLSLMGMPRDFNLVGNILANINHVSQNVCVHSSELMADFILDVLNGKCSKFFNGDYVVQHHKNDTIESRSFNTMENFV